MSKKTTKPDNEPEVATAPSVTIDPKKLHSLNPADAQAVSQSVAPKAEAEEVNADTESEK